MYLSQLNQEEKQAFFNLAYKMVAYNGIEPEEHALLMGAVAEMGLKRVERPAAVDIPTECSRFGSVASKRLAVLELLVLSLADGNFQLEEQRLTQQILNAFGLGERELGEMLAWADRWFAVYNDGRTFVRS